MIKPITTILVVIGFCFMSQLLRSQSIESDSLAAKWLVSAKIASKAKSYNESDSLLLLARNYYKKQKNWDQWFVSVSRSNGNAISRREYKVYLDSLEKFEKILPKDSIFILAKLSFKRGLNHQYLGEIYESVKYFKNSINLLETVKNKYGNTKSYKSYYKTGIVNLANGYSKFNDQGSALKYINSYYSLCKSKGDSCKYLGYKGRYLYYNKDYKKAKTFLTQSIHNCNDATSRYLLAKIYTLQDSLDLAKKQIEILKDESFDQVNYWLALSNYHQNKNGIKLAIDAQENAIIAIEQNPEYSLRTLNKELVELAGLYSENNNLDKAAKLSHKALANVYGLSDSLDLYIRPKVSNNILDIWIILAFFHKAKYFKEKHIVTNNPIDFAESKFYFDRLFASMDRLKGQFYSNFSKYQVGSNNLKIYDEIINYYITLFEKDKDSTLLNQAFLLSQNSNAFVLKHAVSERKALQLTGISQDSIDEYFRLVYEASKDNIEADKGVFNDLDNFKNQISKNYSFYRNFSKRKEIDLNQIQQELEDESLMLKFDLLDGRLLLFAISRNNVKWYKNSLPENFEFLINQHLELISNPNNWDEKSYILNSSLLYNLLLEEVLDDFSSSNISHLYIVPNDLLSNISFAALLKEDTNKTIKPQDYLIWNYSISYMYYSSQLIAKNRKLDNNQNFIGFGLKYEDEYLKTLKEEVFTSGNERERSASLLPLKYAIEEVENCARYFEGLTLTNESATPLSVRDNISNYQIIHISAHALIDASNYLDSYLALYQDVNKDYKFTYEDIVKSNLNADLVVLSACQTGVGSDIKSEGLMSLCRAFTEGGSSSVMGSYWNASDNPTKEIMNLFYKNLKSNIRKSKALQNAQIEYLTNDDISSPRIRIPYYWASWTIYGQDDAYVQNVYFFKKYWKVFAVFLMVMFVFLIFKYKSKKSVRVIKIQ